MAVTAIVRLPKCGLLEVDVHWNDAGSIPCWGITESKLDGLDPSLLVKFAGNGIVGGNQCSLMASVY